MKELYYIISKDGRMFIDEAKDYNEILKKSCIEIKAIYKFKGMIKVYEN